MCYSPIVSISIALIEWVLAAVLLFKFKRTPLRDFCSAFVFILGAFQLSQFFLCTSGNPSFWARIGISVYTLIPALGLWFAIQYTSRRGSLHHDWGRSYVVKSFLVVIPLSITAIALLHESFIIQAYCSEVWVVVQSLFFDFSNHMFATTLYLGYYFGFISLAGWLLGRNMLREKNKRRKIVELLGLVAILCSVLPSIVLIVIIPSLGKSYPSIFCNFALLTSIIAFVAVWQEQLVDRKGK